MKPVMITFYAYAEDDSDGERLQKELYQFVNQKYEEGVLISANKIRNMLNKFRDSVLVNSFLSE
jgi:hypothetical protein